MGYTKIPVKEGVEILCEWVKTRYGFRHDAYLMVKGSEYGKKTKICYYNHIWEAFEFETVVRELIKKTDYLTPEEKTEFLKNFTWEKVK